MIDKELKEKKKFMKKIMADININMKANWKTDGFHKYSDEYGSVVPDCRAERWTLQPAGGIIHQLRGGHLIHAKKRRKKERKRGREELRGLERREALIFN